MSSESGAGLNLDVEGDARLSAPARELVPQPELLAFDYGDAPAEAVAHARSTAETIRTFQKRAIKQIAKIGLLLHGVKTGLGHGCFGAWLKAEFGWSERTAQRYMQVADTIGPESDIVSDLPQALIYKLTSPVTPQELRESILNRRRNGDRVSANDIAAQVSDAHHTARQAAQEKRDEARLSPSGRGSRRRRKAQEQRDREEWANAVQAQEQRAEANAAALVERFGMDVIKAVFAAMDNEEYTWWALRKLVASRVVSASPDEDTPRGGGE